MVTSQQAVSSWRIRTKKKLVDRLGGKCEVCGWSGHIAAYDFHHKDPSTKLYTIASLLAGPRSESVLFDEVDKCMLLCAICHRCLHAEDYDEEKHGLKPPAPRRAKAPQRNCEVCDKQLYRGTKGSLCRDCFCSKTRVRT